MPTPKYTPEEARARKNARQTEYEKRTGYAAKRKYEKENVRRYVISSSVNSEPELIAWLDSKENKAGYIKNLVYADMQKNRKS